MSESKYYSVREIMASLQRRGLNKTPPPEEASVEAERERLIGPQYHQWLQQQKEHLCKSGT